MRWKIGSAEGHTYVLEWADSGADGISDGLQMVGKTSSADEVYSLLEDAAHSLAGESLSLQVEIGVSIKQ